MWFVRAFQAWSLSVLACVVLLAAVQLLAGRTAHLSHNTVAAWFSYWVTHLPEVAVGMLPFAAAGAVFGLVWSRRDHGRAMSRRVERAV